MKVSIVKSSFNPIFHMGSLFPTQGSNKQKSVHTCIPRQRIQGATFTRYVSVQVMTYGLLNCDF